MLVPPDEAVPALHFVHVPLEYPCPLAHDVHFPVAALHAEQVAEQLLHADAPAAEYFIAAHALQVLVPPDEAVPAAHFVHVPLEYPYPLTHCVHCPFAGLQAEQVAEQLLHTDAPAGEYFIAPHALHTLAAVEPVLGL